MKKNEASALPPDVLAELSRLGEDPAKFEWIARSEGAEDIRRFVGIVATTAELFHVWYPRLKSFEADCRRELPCPSDDSLTETQLACLRILHPMVTSDERVPLQFAAVAPIFCAPIYALPLLRREWPGSAPNAVFLTPEERVAWGRIHEDEDPYWWWADQSWNVLTTDLESSAWFYSDPLPTPENGETFWLAERGMMWGSLAGGMSADLWAWNGVRERFVRWWSGIDF